MTSELESFEKWVDEIPEDWRGQPPRDLEERVKYDEFMIQHVRKCGQFTFKEKLKLVHQLGRDLEKTGRKLRNRHECECCGITLHTSTRIGPECAKHPAKFPCNTHRTVKPQPLLSMNKSTDHPKCYEKHTIVRPELRARLNQYLSGK